MKKKNTKLKSRQVKSPDVKTGLYGIDASKASVKVVHGSELTGIVK